MKQSLIQSAKERIRRHLKGYFKDSEFIPDTMVLIEQELTLAIDSYKKELRDKVKETKNNGAYSSPNDVFSDVLSIIDEE